MDVLASQAIDETYLDDLRRRFPAVRFARLAADGAVPPGFSGAEVIVRTGLPREALSRALRDAPEVEWVHTCSAGFDYVLVPEVVARGIRLTRSAASAKAAIAEYVLAVILAFAKKLPLLYEAQRRRDWAVPASESVAGKTVLVVGVGAIGAEVGRLCSAVGMRTVGVKRDPVQVEPFDAMYGSADLDDALPEADYVVLSCPLTTETRGLMGASRLARMKPTACLVNVARGPVIVEDALRAALAERRIGGACLDVFEEEPVPADSWYWAEERCLVTPHCAYNSENVLARSISEFAANLARYIGGAPLENEIRDAALGY